MGEIYAHISHNDCWRFLFAGKNYECYEFRSWSNNPDKLHSLRFPKSFTLNREFNDKGLIYIRHGEPDDTAGPPRRDGHHLHLGQAAADPGVSPHPHPPPVLNPDSGIQNPGRICAQKRT
jgi:hypothetical protein